ncbi:4-hydroxybenzoate octaprenyltransferase [Haematospirillum jordaniae]|uniref:4-hydroxybenzoate octaprenyltransferase n=1 Tax=Haematospirillum jordaniae TaxID=1549855 RepID=A0A143DEY8_9PROT|nr:4-hydroxybenzoate octaprenyltransferase [Haematospirillum jordaniae]AMW34688.1 4-hydroxybenzoate octaprenyltransferase [Haematospirillum jordaniae]NKD44772.1 4-hydroxybenzoate octaprenyltransferase [Haematospirillum jordaniae]NKD56962.1 4-hydroxybenzoate octaprenyltransferase [Haematospirillum jordaniae]NKD58882.1 4-hydroxybenzoate octaprenyltransferase [Haematospirillum jordaniae]NKD66887.1 4-hydroxybenzoate octaprenyltransferase [Haematospirillum jordaniae]
MSNARHMAGDMPVNGWIDRAVPASLRPFLKLLRLDRPVGSWLLLFPCWWSLVLGAVAVDVRLQDCIPSALLFWVGAILMRGAGCAINDVLDRDIDRLVDRTRSRPLASGAVSVRAALILIGLVMLAGLLILVSFNMATILLGLASVPMFLAYPLMKRLTMWPQVWLGLTFSWGALLGWTAVTGAPGWPMLALYAGAFFWVLGYDTIYAHQDREEDRMVGIGSSALALGERTKPAVAVFYGMALFLFTLSAALAGVSWLFYPCLVPALWHAARQVHQLDIDDPSGCLAVFQSNREFGWLVLGACLAGHLSITIPGSG